MDTSGDKKCHTASSAAASQPSMSAPPNSSSAHQASRKGKQRDGGSRRGQQLKQQRQQHKPRGDTGSQPGPAAHALRTSSSSSMASPREPQTKPGEDGARPQGGGANKGKGKGKKGRSGRRGRNSGGSAERVGQGSSTSGGSKKNIVDDMLGFVYETRGVSARDMRQQLSRLKRRGDEFSYARRRPKYLEPLTKEQYIQATCRFYVRAAVNCTACYLDPDVAVPWDSIEQVVMATRGEQTCPICLDPPVVAKITRCGHVFCWPCILHHLSTTTRGFDNCPLCEDMIERRDLKSVVLVSVDHPTTSSTVTFELMARTQGSLLVVPAASLPARRTMGPADVPALKSRCPQLLKVVPLSDTELLINVLRREALELTAAEVDSTDTFVRSARSRLLQRWRQCDPHLPVGASLEEALQSAAELRTKPLPLAPWKTRGEEIAAEAAKVSERQKKQKKQRPGPGQEQRRHDVVGQPSSTASTATTATAPTSSLPALNPDAAEFIPSSVPQQQQQFEVGKDQRGMEGQRGSAKPSNSAATSEQATLTPTSKTEGGSLRLQSSPPAAPRVPQLPTKDMKAPAEDAVFFYQSIDTQPIFLHPLNIKCLVKEYGDLASAPPIVTARVVEVSSAVLDASTRSRLKHLAHLPLRTSYELVELDLTPLLSRATTEHFASDLQRRRQRRRRRRAAENRMAREIEEQQREEVDRLMYEFSLQSDEPRAEDLKDFLPQRRERTISEEEVVSRFSNIVSRGIMADAPALSSELFDHQQQQQRRRRRQQKDTHAPQKEEQQQQQQKKSVWGRPQARNASAPAWVSASPSSSTAAAAASSSSSSSSASTAAKLRTRGPRLRKSALSPTARQALLGKDGAGVSTDEVSGGGDSDDSFDVEAAYAPRDYSASVLQDWEQGGDSSHVIVSKTKKRQKKKGGKGKKKNGKKQVLLSTSRPAQ